MSWPWLVGACVGAVVVVVTVWLLVFRSAMKNPNNGNEFSRDSEGYPPL